MTGKNILIKELDAIFSLFIRTRDLIDNTELAKCVSCGEIDVWRKMDCGHYYSRGENNVLRYDELNCYIQCKVCNIIKKGNYPHFAYNILTRNGAEQGVKTLELLHLKTMTKKRYTVNQLKILIKLYYGKIPKRFSQEADRIAALYSRKKYNNSSIKSPRTAPRLRTRRAQ